MEVESDICKLPYSCYINLTSSCNLRCKHCFGSYSVQTNTELNWRDWENVVNNLIDCKVFFINISGGEPTQSPYFKDFIKLLTKKGIHFILTTNGVFSDNIRDFILDYQEYLISIKVSLDGPDAASHCYIRLDQQGKQNHSLFDITLKNILFFRDNNIPLAIATVIHKGNVSKMDEFQKLIKDINPVNWFISPLIPVGRAEENDISECYECYNPEFWKKLTKENTRKGIDVRLIDVPVNITGKLGLSAYECAAALNFCEIHSDGTVSPCTLCRICIPDKFMKFENIKDKSLGDIWKGELFEKFRSFMNKGCEGCKMLSKCNKCIAQSFRYFGDGVSPTPFCVKNGDKLMLKKQEDYKKVLKEEFDIVL